jgi:outer membrane lipoprotein-sorting protein
MGPKLIIVALFAASAALPARAFAEPDPILNEILGKIRATQNVRAEFVEETFSGSAHTAAKGTLLMRQPDALRRTTFLDNGQSLLDEIDDGETHWSIDKGQTAQKTLGGLSHVKTLFPLFSSSLLTCRDCAQQPWLRYLGKAACDDGECYVYQHGQYFEWVGVQDGLLRRLTVCQFSESTRLRDITLADAVARECAPMSRTEYKNVKANGELDAGAFTYDPAEGVTVTEIDRRSAAPLRRTWTVRPKGYQLSASDRKTTDERLAAVKQAFLALKSYSFQYSFRRGERAGNGNYIFKAPSKTRIALRLADIPGALLYGQDGEHEWHSAPPMLLRTALLLGPSAAAEESPLAALMARIPAPLASVRDEMIAFRNDDRVGETPALHFEITAQGSHPRLGVWVGADDGIVRKIIEYHGDAETGVYDVFNVKANEEIDDSVFLRAVPGRIPPRPAPNAAAPRARPAPTSSVLKARIPTAAGAAQKKPADDAAQPLKLYGQFFSAKNDLPADLRGGGTNRTLSHDLYLRFVSTHEPLLRRGTRAKRGDLDALSSWFSAQFPEDKHLLDERGELEISAGNAGDDNGVWLLHHKRTNTWFFRSWKFASTLGD